MWSPRAWELWYDFSPKPSADLMSGADVWMTERINCSHTRDGFGGGKESFELRYERDSEDVREVRVFCEIWK